MTFNGKYFDGKSSAGYKAEITLEPYHIRIVYKDTIGNTRITHWNTDLIQKNDFAENDRVYLKYGKFPYEYIDVPDKQMELELKRFYPKAEFHKTPYNRLFSSGVRGLILVGAFFLGFVALCYFVLIPAAADNLAKHLPLSYEQKMGEAIFADMTKFDKINEPGSKLLNQFFKDLNYRSDYPVEITVVKSNIVNAYALPGGKIVVYEGIIHKMNDSKELVALLSHEFSHVQLRHTTRNICRSLSSYLLVSLIIGDAGGITAVVLQNADQLKQLGYSRGLEEEADREGMKLMQQDHIDLNGMKHLFEALKKEQGDAEVPQFLSTHPLTGNRIKAVSDEIKKSNFQTEEHPQLDSLWNLIKEESGD